MYKSTICISLYNFCIFDRATILVFSFILLFAVKWRKYVHEVLVNRLGGLSLPRKSVVRLTDRPDMTLDVYRGRKTTMQHILHAKGNDLDMTVRMHKLVLVFTVRRGQNYHFPCYSHYYIILLYILYNKLFCMLRPLLYYIIILLNSCVSEFVCVSLCVLHIRVNKPNN